jgi:hypothetical protein
VWTDSASRASVVARVRHIRDGACYRQGLDTAASNGLGGPGAIAYELSVDDSAHIADVANVAHAVPGQSAWRIMNGRAYGDVDGDGSEEIARVCTSMEGLHFTLWRQSTGSPPRRVGHLYHYLGYDVDPSCTEDEVKG